MYITEKYLYFLTFDTVGLTEGKEIFTEEYEFCYDLGFAHGIAYKTKAR